MTHHGFIGAVLYAKDLAWLVELYRAVVGIEPQTAEKGFAVFGSIPSQFVIVRIPKNVARSIDISSPPKPRHGIPLKLVFAVEDIANARDRAARLGGAVNAVKHEWNFEGTKVCDGHDPEGNVFQIRQID